METIKFYIRYIYHKTWVVFCLRFARRCSLLKPIIDNSKLDDNYGFIILEKRQREIKAVGKRRVKIQKRLKGYDA
jgi:hypothetical protein